MRTQNTELTMNDYLASPLVKEPAHSPSETIEMFGPLGWENALTPLREISLRVRERILRLAVGCGGYVGSALSCADLLVYLYTRYLNVTPDNLKDPSRDYLFLSKGHAVPALYATLVEVGLLSPDELKICLHERGSIYWHPHRSIAGVEFHAGSLGHLLPVAVGVALDCKQCGGRNRIVVITGDGELDEGSNWEACLVAASYRLDNLIVVVDRNYLQANVRTEALLPLEPLEIKFKAFGCETMRVNGHSFEAIDQAFASLPLALGRPSVVIADTIRGRGVPSLQDRVDRWFVKLTAEEVEPLIAELYRNAL